MELPIVERCGNCRFYWEMWDGAKGMSDQLEWTDTPWGLCRRYPPQRSPGQVNRHDYNSFNLPVIARGDWCGEFQASPPAKT